MEVLANLINAAILAGTPLLFGTLGEMLTEKSGNLNLGVEGLMFMGAIAGLAGAYGYENAAGMYYSGNVAALLACVCAFFAGVFGALIYSFLTVTLRANQNVTGLTLAIFGTGFANFFGEHLGILSGGFVAVGDLTKQAFRTIYIPGLSSIPYVGKIFFSYNFMVYLGVIIALILAYFLNKTRLGLNVRAVGESPATADAAGINVSVVKYSAGLIGGGICALGGMYIAMVTSSGVWVHNCVSGQGFIAVALVIFASWRPKRALIGSLLFGGLSIMRYYVKLPIPMQIYDMLPFVATVVVLIITSMLNSKENAQPKSCGLNYFREER